MSSDDDELMMSGRGFQARSVLCWCQLKHAAGSGNSAVLAVDWCLSVSQAGIVGLSKRMSRSTNLFDTDYF